jgi:hypothetical protein
MSIIDEPRMQRRSGTTKPRIKKTNKALRKVLDHASYFLSSKRKTVVEEYPKMTAHMYPQTACSFTVDQHDSKKQD